MKVTLLVSAPLEPVMVKVLLGVDEQIAMDTTMLIVWPGLMLKIV